MQFIAIALFAIACGRGSGPPTQIDPPSEAGALAPQLTVDGDSLLGTWLEPRTVGHRLQFARWREGAWSQPVTIVEHAKLLANWADTPSVVAGGGMLVASWPERTSGEGYDAIVARSVDGGASWTRIGPLHTDGTVAEHGFVALSPAPHGARAIWLDGRAMPAGGAMGLRSAVVGETVTDETLIDDRVCDCCGTAIAGDVIAYRDRSADEVRDIALGPERVLYSDGWQIAGCPVNGPAVARDGDIVAIAWFTGAGATSRVRAAFSRDGGKRFEPPIELDATSPKRTPLGRVGIAIAGDGEAIVSWLVARGEAGEIIGRRIRTSGKHGAEVSIASTGAGRSSGFPRLARLGDHVAIAWRDPAPPGRIHVTRLALARF